MGNKILLACLFFFLGHIAIWFQVNSQFLWKWWEDKAILAIVTYCLPIGFFFFYGWRNAVLSLDSLWSARLLGFGISYLVFPFLTYFLMGESPFNFKTMSCIMLSFVIVGIQIFWK